MAHPDDAELWAGGTIAAHVRHGGTAMIAVPRHDPVRDAEAASGADILGASPRLLDDPGPAALAALLYDLHPDVVITHPVKDMHPDHSHCASSLLAALPDSVIATCGFLRAECGHMRRRPPGRVAPGAQTGRWARPICSMKTASGAWPAMSSSEGTARPPIRYGTFAAQGTVPCCPHPGHLKWLTGAEDG